MTHRTAAVPPAPPRPPTAMDAPARLAVAWAELVAAPALALAWSALRLWDYPRARPSGPARGVAGGLGAPPGRR